MMKSVFIQQVTQFINDLYPSSPEKQHVLAQFIFKANSPNNEGVATTFLEEHGISVDNVSNYAAFGTLPQGFTRKPVVDNRSIGPQPQMPASSRGQSQSSSAGSSATTTTTTTTTATATTTTTSQAPNEDIPYPSYQMIMQVIHTAIAMPDELNTVMKPDETQEYDVDKISPEQQLQQCMKDCQGLSPEEIAIYLYTTYLYGPLNAFLRGMLKMEDMGKSVQPLITMVSQLLHKAFEGTPGQELLSKFRMELKPSWMGNKNVGDTVTFQGFTSAHPDLDGINAMWENIENGAFGETEDRLALLVFEGKSKIIRPQTKYFRKEVEDILPHGTIGKIIKKYPTTWTDPKTGKVWNIDVYHLMIQPSSKEDTDGKYVFSHAGTIEKTRDDSDDDDDMATDDATAPTSTTTTTTPATTI